MWRQQQQQLAAMGSGPAWQQPGTAPTAVTAATAAGAANATGRAPKVPCVTVSLEGTQVSPYGITGQAAASAAGTVADADTSITETAAAAAAEGSSADVALLPMGCPLLLVRQSPTRCAGAGWSLLLPAGWVTPFWMSLTHAGDLTLLCRDLLPSCHAAVQCVPLSIVMWQNVPWQ